MKKVFALFALLFAIGISQGEVCAQNTSQSSYSYNTPDRENQDYIRFLHAVAHELNRSCGTSYCFEQLYQAHKEGELSLEQVDRYSWRVSLGGNITIITLEEF